MTRGVSPFTLHSLFSLFITLSTIRSDKGKIHSLTMPPRRSTRRRAKATSKKSTRISKRQAVQSTEEEINEEIDVEEVKIKQEEINEIDNVVDDLERSPDQLKGVNDDILDDKSLVVAFTKPEMDGVLEENLNFNGNDAIMFVLFCCVSVFGLVLENYIIVCILSLDV